MRQGLEATLTRNDDSTNPSARLDIDTDSLLARITFWDSGDVDLEVIKIESEETVYAEQIHLTGSTDFDMKFRDFFAAIAA